MSAKPRREFSWAELLERPRETYDEITKGGVTVLVTRHGSIRYLIRPVTDDEIMSAVFTEGPLAEELRRRAAEADES